MKFLLIGTFDSWMGLHLEHFSKALRESGCDVLKADYHDMERWHGIPLPRKLRNEQRQRSLEKIVKRLSPDICFFAGSCKFDLPRLKSYWNGTAVYHDYDGPRRNTPEDFFRICDNGIFLTVSRYMERELKKRGKDAWYVPHGTDTDYYAPSPGGNNGPVQAECSFIGRATQRRVEICKQVPCKLDLYGARWKNTELADSCRLKRDVQGQELTEIYRSSGIMLNALQEPLDQFRTILSLQCFAIPASAGCLCAEWVEEFPETFEDGKEVLTFRSPEEMREIIARVGKDADLSRRIGEAGRKRCLAEHTHRHRAEQILKILR